MLSVCCAELAGKGAEIFSGYRVSEGLDKLHLTSLKFLQFVCWVFAKKGIYGHFNDKNRYT